METKQPSYYRDLLESIISESPDWLNKVSTAHDALSIYMKMNHLIHIGDDTVVLTRIEVPLISGYNGMIGAYFMDQDVDLLKNIYNDQNAWAQLEKLVGDALGLGPVKLSVGRDFFKPLNGSHDVGIRPMLPSGVTEKLLGQYIVAAGKDKILKVLSSLIRSGTDVGDIMSALEKQNVDWPELNAIRKSMQAGR